MILSRKRTEFVRMYPDYRGDSVIVLRHEDSPTWIGRLLGCRWRCRDAKYVGSGTVWHELPGFRRCPSSQEAALASIWRRERRYM